MNNEELAAAARTAAEGSYSPYSNFRVGAVAVAANGEVFPGANVENSSYPMTTCAETAAITAAVSRGVRKIDAVAVACIDASDIEHAYPCGGCRQKMAEFGVERVIVTSGEGSEISEHTLEELLPHQFNL